MIDTAGCARIDHGKIVRMGRNIVEPIGNPEAALTMLLPGALTLQQRRVAFSHRGDGWLKARRQGLASEFVEQRFVIKGVQVAGAAFHEEEDDVFCLSDSLRRAR